MMSANREELRQLIDVLPEEALDAAHEALRRMMSGAVDEAQERVNQRLLATGRTRHIPRAEDIRNRPQTRPLSLEGKPVSETLVEERR